MSENKKQSIIDKINEMKQKKILNERDNKLRKIKDIIDRSNDKSKLKIKWSSEDFTKNKVLWIMSSNMKTFNLFDSNETSLLNDSNLGDVLECIDDKFCEFWNSDDDIDIDNMNITIEIYEDVGNEDVDILKRRVITENHNIIEFCMMSKIIDYDSDEEEEEFKMLGDVKQILINQYINSLVRLEKMKLKNSEMEEKCVCDDCETNKKSITIDYIGFEKKDLYMESKNDIGLELKKVINK